MLFVSVSGVRNLDGIWRNYLPQRWLSASTTKLGRYCCGRFTPCWTDRRSILYKRSFWSTTSPTCVSETEKQRGESRRENPVETSGGFRNGEKKNGGNPGGRWLVRCRYLFVRASVSPFRLAGWFVIADSVPYAHDGSINRDPSLSRLGRTLGGKPITIGSAWIAARESWRRRVLRACTRGKFPDSLMHARPRRLISFPFLSGSLTRTVEKFACVWRAFPERTKETLTEDRLSPSVAWCLLFPRQLRFDSLSSPLFSPFFLFPFFFSFWL